MSHSMTLDLGNPFEKIQNIFSKPLEEQNKKNIFSASVLNVSRSGALSHQTKEKLWNIAWIVSFVVFIAVAAGSFGVSYVFAPLYAPLIAATAISLVPAAMRLYSYMYDKQLHEAQLAKQEEGIAKEFQRLSTKSFSKISSILAKEGIRKKYVKNLDHLGILHSLTAQYKYFNKIPNQHKKICHQLRHEKAETEEILLANLKETELLSQQALEAKIKAAYLHGLIKRPDFEKDLSALCTTHTLEVENLLLLQKHKKNPPFLIFINKKIKPLTIKQVEKLSIQEISKKIFQAA